MTQTQYKIIRKEIDQLKAKVAALGAIERFAMLARRARKFARAKGIKPADVLKGD